MQSISSDVTAFVGSVPENYEKYMVPMLMEPYAIDQAERVANHVPHTVLETAAGTGVLTGQLRKQLSSAEITATDLNADMLERAKATRPNLNVTWQQADAMELPFPDGWFDIVAMQFGYMFMSDKAVGAKQAYRVLRPGGRFVFNVWDSISQNEMSAVSYEALTDLIEPGPPQFMNVPFGSFDPAPILEVLTEAGFDATEPTYVSQVMHAESAKAAASGMVLGTPLYGAIVEHGKDAEAIREVLTNAFVKHFGDGPISGKMQAIVYEARKHR
jgi:ubiquinone/menaquinone biosynthesis C-methylase UbiE